MKLLITLGLAVVLLGSTSGNAQIIKKKSKAESKSDSSKVDNYDKLLKGSVSDSGMFSVHRKGTDYYFEIADSLLGRDMLIVNKISGVPLMLNDAGINKGMGYGEKLIRFESDTLHKKLWVKLIDPRITAPKGDAIAQSVKDNYKSSILEQFEIAATNKKNKTTLVKVNKVFDGSKKSFNDIFGALSLNSPSSDLSKIESMKSFPENVIVRSRLTTVITEGGEPIPVTVDITTNIVLLSKEPMKARFADERVGFFTTQHLFYNDKQQKADLREFVQRWRLEPKEEDKERYLKGEKVTPQKPIVLYVDPATPPQWVSYIKLGIEQWNDAFEAAGFKNAIEARTVDTLRDKDFDIDDVRYSVVTYVASEMANAMGPSVVDPRSGEIIEADIIWWHNVMSILHAWMRVQTGAIDPSARGNELPVDLMGNAIRFVSSHELGHSLGMKHNMGSSSGVPVDSLRSPSYTSKIGTAHSIMDYARFNYVAQPEDSVKHIIPIIGAYDKHAIGWAYRWLDTKTPYEELATLNKWLKDTENDPKYWYGEQSREGIDPRSQSEDLGDDAVKASELGLKNLQRIVPNIVSWTQQEGELQFGAGSLLMATVFQWKMYADHVKTNVGGFYINNVVANVDKPRYTPVPASKQKESVAYLIRNVFTAPMWLFGSDVWKRCYAQRNSPIGQIEYAPYNFARELQYGTYYDLLSDDRLLRMYESEAAQGRKNTYTPEEMLSQITSAVFGKVGTLSLYERMSQKNYVDALIVSSNLTMVKTTKKGSTLHSDNCCSLAHTAPEIELEHIARPEEISFQTNRHYGLMQRVSETTSAKRGEMSKILNLTLQRVNSGDIATRNHYNDLVLRLREALSITNAIK